MFSDKGINLVVDQIFHNNDPFSDCIETLRQYPICFAGVHCPLSEWNIVKRLEEIDV